MYTLFLYKTSGFTGTAPCIYMTNRALSSNSSDEWERNSVETCMKAFDASNVRDESEKAVKVYINLLLNLPLIKKQNTFV